MCYLNLLKSFLSVEYAASLTDMYVQVFRITPIKIRVASFVVTYVDNNSTVIASAEFFFLAPLLKSFG